MKTFKEIADLAIENGFMVVDEADYYFMIFKRKDGINVEVSFPNDNLTPSIIKEEYLSSISWEFRLIDSRTGNVLYKDYIECYDDTPDEMIISMLETIRRFIYKISFLPLRIVEGQGLKIFGKEFFKLNKLEFKENDNWIEY